MSPICDLRYKVCVMIVLDFQNCCAVNFLNTEVLVQFNFISVAVADDTSK